MNNNTLEQDQSLFAGNVAKLIIFIQKSGFGCTFGEAWRSADQAKLYAEQGKGIINSLHCKRMAVDLNLFADDGDYLTDKASYQPFGTYWKSLYHANRWGGDFVHLVDSNHFEMQDLD